MLALSLRHLYCVVGKKKHNKETSYPTERSQPWTRMKRLGWGCGGIPPEGKKLLLMQPSVW